MRSRCPIPALAKSSVKAKWLSVDPYMRGRMSPATNYTKGVEIGEVMQGGGVGEVVASNHPKWKEALKDGILARPQLAPITFKAAVFGSP